MLALRHRHRALHKETQGQQMERLYGTRAINLKWKESTEEINGKWWRERLFFFFGWARPHRWQACILTRRHGWKFALCWPTALPAWRSWPDAARSRVFHWLALLWADEAMMKAAKSPVKTLTVIYRAIPVLPLLKKNPPWRSHPNKPVVLARQLLLQARPITLSGPPPPTPLTSPWASAPRPSLPSITAKTRLLDRSDWSCHRSERRPNENTQNTLWSTGGCLHAGIVRNS